MAVRHKEHRENAMRKGTSNYKSHFYAQYPRKESEHARNPQRRVYFDSHLQQYVGIGVDPAKKKLLCTCEIGSLFDWPLKDLKRIEKVNFAGCLTLEAKQYKMIGYLFEKAYDLCISPSVNVSRNPGFETPLGIFG